MTKYSVKRIKNLKIVLKNLENSVKDPRFLRIGRNFGNFPLRPREVLANWLLCAVINFDRGEEKFTFAEDPTGGDGIIIARNSEEFMLMEHVFIPEPSANNIQSVEDIMVKAVKHKMSKGKSYAQGKNLVIFSEAI